MNWRTRTFLAFAITTILFAIASLLLGVSNLYELFTFPVSPLHYLESIFWNITVFLQQFSEVLINYTNIFALTIACYTAAAILLIKDTHKKTAWAFAMVPPIFLLLNPLFVQGTLILLVQNLIEADFWGAWTAIADSILPALVIIYAITSLAGVKNRIFDKTIGIIFSILFLLLPWTTAIARGNPRIYDLAEPLIKFAFFLILVILLPKMLRKD
jgi:hypothetical protein